MHQHEAHQKRGESGPVLFQPPLEDFKQDHIIPMDGAVALVDNTYKKHKNAFVIYSKAGEETFLADSEKDLNEWLGVLNYTAAFETLGVRSRGMIGGLYEGQKNRGIRRLESSSSVKSIPTSTGEVTVQSGKIDSHFAQQMMTARRETMQTRISESEEKLVQHIRELEARLRDARHLQILAPVQPKTREQVIHAAGRLSAKLKWARIEIWRMKCHRDILAHELEDEKQGAAERQARIDKVAEFGPVPQQQLSPQQSHRGSKISGLARLTSKTSSLTSGPKPPLSPGLSIRPGTKSSRDTEFGGDDAYKTPPEMSRQSSPNDPSGKFHLPPMSLGSHASDRRSSVASSSAPTQSPRLLPSEHRPSIVTTDDGTGTVDSDSDSDDDSRYTTPPPIEHGTAEPKTPEIPSLDGMRPDVAVESDADQALGSAAGSPASHTKHRRSLHRTLREGSHRRSHKGRDSSSTIVSEDAQDSEGLTRDKGSFTVHGKKASVIQFGGDWHNTTAEERLKRKKELQDAADALTADERDGNSIGSGGTANAFSPGFEPSEGTPRKLSVGAVKQRHTSAQTITPASYKESLEEHNNNRSDDSEMSDIAEESHERTSAEQAAKKQKATPTKIDVFVEGGPKPLPVTSPTTTNLVQM